VQPASTLCGRSVSLLPLTHIAVVDAADIVGTMADYLRTVDKDALPSQICFISGPSATADIELVRVEGVHGPMYVHYVILEN
jgi:L-lactate dehydrogenase complex protein LldG